MRSTAIEEMKELSAEFLRKRGYTIENGTLRKAGLGVMRKPSWDYE